jgi:hydrogenase-4 membrane subunit HyfE
MSEEKFWCIFWGIVGTVIITLIISSFTYTYHIKKLAMENGYQKVVLPIGYESFYQKAPVTK